MIIVIADSADAALRVARLSNFGTGPQAWPTEAEARRHAQRCYPLPHFNRYCGWRVPVSLDGTLLQPTSFPLDAPSENA